MSNEDKEILKMLTSAYERFICITLIFVLLFFIIIQKPEILISVIERLTELIKTSGIDLGIMAAIIMPKLYK